MVFEKHRDFLDFRKMGEIRISEMSILHLNQRGSDFLWHLKKCIVFLDFRKMQATRFCKWKFYI